MSKKNKIKKEKFSDSSNDVTEKISRADSEILWNFQSKTNDKIEQDLNNLNNFTEDDSGPALNYMPIMDQDFNEAQISNSNNYTNEAMASDLDFNATDEESQILANNMPIDSIPEVTSEDIEMNRKRFSKIALRFPNAWIILKYLKWVILFIILLSICFGVWSRWFRYDDHADISGNWQIAEKNTNVLIDNEKIVLGQNAILNYTVDPVAKLIYYKTGDMSGVSHYRFSFDRKQIALVENVGDNPVILMFNDLTWFFSYCACKITGNNLSPAYTKDDAQISSNAENFVNPEQKNSILLIKKS